MSAAWVPAAVLVALAVLAAMAHARALLPASAELGEERGDYRLRRTGRRWTVERVWFGQWRPVAPLASYGVAWAYYCELTEWQALATNPMRDVMRESLPAAARRGMPWKDVQAREGRSARHG